MAGKSISGVPFRKGYLSKEEHTDYCATYLEYMSLALENPANKTPMHLPCQCVPPKPWRYIKESE